MRKAPKVPDVPLSVLYETVISYIKDIDAIPVGFNVKNGNISTLNLLKNRISFICGNQINAEPTFLLELTKIFMSIPNAKLKIIDLAENMSEANIEEYYNGEFTQTITNIITAEQETKQKIVYIITGIGYIYDRVLDEGKSFFDRTGKAAGALAVGLGAGAVIKGEIPSFSLVKADRKLDIQKLE